MLQYKDNSIVSELSYIVIAYLVLDHIIVYYDMSFVALDEVPEYSFGLQLQYTIGRYNTLYSFIILYNTLLYNYIL